MNRYELRQELNALYSDLDMAKNKSEQEVCEQFVVDTRQEIMEMLEGEIKRCEAMLNELDEAADDGMDYIGLQVSQGLPVFLPGRM